MKQPARNVKIIGRDSYTPDTVYTNKYLETIVPSCAQWIFDNVGIKVRRIASLYQLTSDLVAIKGHRTFIL